MRNTDRIIPELQHLQEGDVVRLGPDPYPAYTVWSIQPDRSWDYVNRGLVYLGFLALGLFVGALVPRATRSVANGLAALLGALLAYALLAKGLPALYADYGRLARLRTPVGRSPDRRGRATTGSPSGMPRRSPAS